MYLLLSKIAWFIDDLVKFARLINNLRNFVREMAEYWIISAPGDKTCQETWDKLNKATGEYSQNFKFNIPDLKVGTLDQLVGLSDDLTKLDTYAERFIVRDFVYDEEILNQGKNERDKLFQEKVKQYGPLVRWLRINFSEQFSAWVHVKAYGLPVNFQPVLVLPNKRHQKKLRELLNQLYAHLDASGNASSSGVSANMDMTDELPALMSFGQQEYYPYVFFKINIDLIESVK
uniref:V-type proton ATPase subunit C n=1 Tax=Romanomermis culicivorax TaxID=13658 RepID=A0A915LAE3_ROMCU